MPNTVEHKVEMFMLARERRAQGKPVWDRTIRIGHVWRNENMTFTERRDAVVRILRASPWVKDRDEFDQLVEVVDNLAEAEDAEEFDGWWDELYDHADGDRVWIDRF
ncbi:hypothetical protein [Nonomuraea rubra]|uniref:hypothetical protein n=1 Tax=Nonomuraea rubra TaxID=46180 RepID=UPI0033D6E719